MGKSIIRLFALLALFMGLFGAPIAAKEAPKAGAQTILAEAGPGTRWGMVVADEEGKIILSINPDGRFMPASNTKIVTTMAGMEQRDKLPDSSGDVYLLENRRGKPVDIVIEGRGNVSLSTAPNCKENCLSAVADAIAAKTKKVRNITGDARYFKGERWSTGMSWNNMAGEYGTAITALGVDNNVISAIITPAAAGAAPKISRPAYFNVQNLAQTALGDGNTIVIDRLPGNREIIISGAIGDKTAPQTLELGVDDPAHYAAWALGEMLKARGVKIKGNIASNYSGGSDGDKGASLPLPPIDEAADITLINKESQNLHAEILLRRLGEGKVANGLKVVKEMLGRVGVKEHEIDLYDGSGMSAYNRVTPSAMVRLLSWARGQTWFKDWRATLPIGAVDGTLTKRFIATSLAGNIWAKTGTLNGTSALAGYMKAKSGRTLTFAIYANDVPEGVRERAIMDRALLYVAENN